MLPISVSILVRCYFSPIGLLHVVNGPAFVFMCHRLRLCAMPFVNVPHSHQGSKLGGIARSQLAPRYFFLGANSYN